MRALLMVIGGLGLLISIPSAAFAWMMFHGFGGVFTLRDWLVVLSPLPCILIFFAGMFLRTQR